MNWDDTVTLVGIVGVLSAALSSLGTQFYSRRRDSREKRVIKREQQAADDIASDRLIRLAEEVADKRVAVMRVDFELIIANLKLEQLAKDAAKERELAELRAQIAAIRQDAEKYHCDLAPACDQNPSRAKTATGGPY